MIFPDNTGENAGYSDNNPKKRLVGIGCTESDTSNDIFVIIRHCLIEKTYLYRRI